MTSVLSMTWEPKNDPVRRANEFICQLYTQVLHNVSMWFVQCAMHILGDQPISASAVPVTWR